MPTKCRIPSIKNWSSETNRELSLRLMTLAKHKPMLYTEFKQLEAERIAKLVFIANGNAKKGSGRTEIEAIADLIENYDPL